MNTPKLFRDGKVAVLVSPGYGAGWSTWANKEDDEPVLMFHPRLVAAKENGMTQEQVDAVLADLGVDAYTGGWHNVKIEWVTPGTHFRVTETDGYEVIQFREETNWRVA